MSPKYKNIPQVIFLLFFTLYLIFPGDHELREVGFGSHGSRILLLDIFVIIFVISSLGYILSSSKKIINYIGFIPIIFFLGTSSFSLIRGLPLYGGWAIGEARWFFLIIFLPIGYAIYDNSLLKKIKKIFYIAAFYHSGKILFLYLIGKAWDTSGGIMRYGGGRGSLIIGIVLIFTLIDEAIYYKKDVSKALRKIILILFFLFVILISQTRTIFIIIPLCLFFLYLIFYKIQLWTILKYVLVAGVFVIFINFFLYYLFPPKMQQSIDASFEVINEIFDPDTYFAMLHPASLVQGDFKKFFSASGNTYFRVLAWSQVIYNVYNTPGGLYYGEPMGAGFEFYNPDMKQWLVDMQPHNDYIVIFSKIGIIGLLGYIMLLGKYFNNTRKLKRFYNFDNILISEIVLITIILIMIMSFAFLNPEIRTYGSHFWVWLFVGFGFRYLFNSDINNTKIKLENI